MSRNRFSPLFAVALAAAVLALSATPASAARRVGWYGGGYRGGYYGYRGGSYGGWGRGYAWGYPGYYGRGVGVGFYNAPYYSGGFAYAYPTVVYSSGVPSLTTYDGVPPVEARASFYPPANVFTPGADASATVDVRVPSPDAEVWFDGDPTRQKGDSRVFTSPPLATGRDFHYEVRARWMENGKPVEETRRVSVRGGATTEVDFTKPAGK